MNSPETNITRPPLKLTTGPISDVEKKSRRDLIHALHASGEVQEVIAIAWSDVESKWFYFIKCPASWVFPKYAIGSIDAELTDANPIVQCEEEWAAREEWARFDQREYLDAP